MDVLQTQRVIDRSVMGLVNHTPVRNDRIGGSAGHIKNRLEQSYSSDVGFQQVQRKKDGNNTIKFVRTAAVILDQI